MTTRREVLIGGALLAASGGAYALTPRQKVSLLGEAELEALVPRTFGEWREQPTEALVVPQTEGSLASRLYGQSVGRVYTDARGDTVMALIAHGDTQSDQLQIHRPEVCYPAFGFNVQDSHKVGVPLAAGAMLPARRMRAIADQRREQILYWTRIGEFLPASDAEQRWAKLRTAFGGVRPDGVLVRLSNLADDPRAGHALNLRFAAALLNDLSRSARRVLIGTDLTARLS